MLYMDEDTGKWVTDKTRLLTFSACLEANGLVQENEVHSENVIHGESHISSDKLLKPVLVSE
jgi:hypothetical protein